jgi:hypothetical protein
MYYLKTQWIPPLALDGVQMDIEEHLILRAKEYGS